MIDERTAADAVETKLSEHIFSVSAGLVGVCITVIGLFRLIVRSEHVDSIADDLLAIDALCFLVACFLAYLTLRSREPNRRARFERVADGAFLIGLTMMVAVGALIAYEII